MKALTGVLSKEVLPGENHTLSCQAPSNLPTMSLSEISFRRLVLSVAGLHLNITPWILFWFLPSQPSSTYCKSALRPVFWHSMMQKSPTVTFNEPSLSVLVTSRHEVSYLAVYHPGRQSDG